MSKGTAPALTKRIAVAGMKETVGGGVLSRGTMIHIDPNQRFRSHLALLL